MKKYFLLVSVFFLIPFSALAQKRAFTIEDFYRIKAISDVHVSPDGKSVVYAVASPNLARAERISHIWTMNVDGRNARQITNGDKGESSPAFSPDGRWISYSNAADGNLYAIPT